MEAVSLHRPHEVCIVLAATAIIGVCVSAPRFGVYRIEQTMEELHRNDPTKVRRYSAVVASL